jgi:hypothetical protein
MLCELRTVRTVQNTQRAALYMLRTVRIVQTCSVQCSKRCVRSGPYKRAVCSVVRVTHVPDRTEHATCNAVRVAYGPERIERAAYNPDRTERAASNPDRTECAAHNAERGMRIMYGRDHTAHSFRKNSIEFVRKV